jgi:hypothetical protein
MANKLSQFYSNFFGSGIAKPNKFEVMITPPSSIYSSLNDPALLRHFTLTCESVSIPSQTLFTTEAKINGLPVIPLPYQINYGNTLSLTFKLSADYRERNAFLIWQDLIHKPGIGFSYYNDYIGTIAVRPLNHQEQPTQEFIFRNCFPTIINNLEYNWGANNDNLKQVVGFSFFTMETRTNTIRSNWDRFPEINRASSLPTRE